MRHPLPVRNASSSRPASLRRALVLWPVVVLTWGPGAAIAQAATDVTTLAPVVVTAKPDPLLRAPDLATGLADTQLETPFATTRVPADLVREQAGKTLQDALRNVPGAQADSGFNGAHTQFFILRGAVSDSGTGANRVLRDGVRLSNYPYVPAFVEAVEVLRGPGAATAVRSEPGGTVNLVTLQPQRTDAASARVAFGSARARERSVDLNRVLSASRETAARLIVTQSHASEWRHVPDRLEGLKLGLATSDGGRYHLRTGFEATNQVYRPDYGLPSLGSRPVAVPRDRQLGEPFGDATTRNRVADLHGDVAVSPHTRLALSLTHLEATSTAIRNVLTGNPLAGQPPGTWARTSSWEPGTRRRIDSAALSQTTAATLAGVPHALYASLAYYRETLHQPTLTLPASSSAPINVFDPVFGGVSGPAAGTALPSSLMRQDLEATTLSVQDTIELGAWTLVPGVRLDQQTFVYGTAAVQPVDESRWSPKVAVLRKLSAHDTLYANVSTGTSPNQVASSTNQSLPSRRAAQAELGWKSLWRDGALVSEVAVYQLDQTNMISSDLSTANNFDFTVDGSARSQGLEASLTGAVGDRLDVAATYAYTAAAYRQNAVNGGRHVPNVARQAASVWAQYGWSDAWKTGLGVQAQGRRFADASNTVVLPGHARVDAVQRWLVRRDDGQHLDLQFAVRNLFDQAYHVSSHLHVARWVAPAPGREFTLSAACRF